jgi:hypothetical protein
MGLIQCGIVCALAASVRVLEAMVHTSVVNRVRYRVR